MILWTVMPLDMVFGQEEVVNPYEELDYEGTKMMVERVSSNQCRIVRILSTDPQDFLRQEIQPGTIITYRPTLELQ